MKLNDDKFSKNREIATAILRKFDDASNDRKTNTTHFPDGLDKELEDCHNIRRGIMLDEEVEIADELAHVGLEFAKRKAVSAIDIISDLVRNSIDAPILEPTEVPELPEDIKAEILAKLKEELYQNEYSGDLQALAKRIKNEAVGTLKDKAKAAAAQAEIYLRDTLQELDYRQTSRDLIDDFVSMPYCVAKSPHYEFVEDPKWVGNKWVMERKLKANIKRVPPARFYILNGTNAQNAEAVFERDHTTVHHLNNVKNEAGWRTAEIEYLLDEDPSKDLSQGVRYIFTGAGGESLIKDVARATVSDTKEYLWFYGRLRGSELNSLGVDKELGKKYNDRDTYEVCAAILDDLVIHLSTMPINSAKIRPYHVACYEKLNGHWAGIGIIQRVKRAERVVRSFMYASIRNASFSSRPTGEVDYDRLSEFYPSKEDLSEFMSGHMYLTKPDATGMQGGRPAVNFYQIQNNTQSLIAGMTFFLDLLDLLSAVPKLGSGDMRGMATLGRSYRGIAMVQQAEAKTIRAALDNFDQQIQEPILTRMYYHIQETGPATVKGDAQIKARSTSGYLMKEANAAARQETLNTAVGLAQANLVKPELLQSLVLDMFRDQGIDVDRFYDETQDTLDQLTPSLGEDSSGQPQSSGARATNNVVPTVKGFGNSDVPV